MTSIRYSKNESNATQIIEHLLVCDSTFIPRLSDRVSIDEYSHKIFSRAQRYEAWARNELVGLVAAYHDTQDKKSAFITNVSVIPAWRNQQIAKNIMINLVADLKKYEFISATLKVYKRNTIAFEFYSSLDFHLIQAESNESEFYMRLEISY